MTAKRKDGAHGVTRPTQNVCPADHSPYFTTVFTEPHWSKSGNSGNEQRAHSDFRR